MKSRWLGIGLAVTAVSALGVVALRRRQSAQELPPNQQPAELPPAQPESSVPKLSSVEVVQALDGWLRTLGIDRIGQPGFKPPDPATVTQATLFAAELARQGYQTAADTLRAGLQAITSVPPTVPPVTSSEGPETPPSPPPEPSAPAVESSAYLIGWKDTSDNAQMIVRQALGELGADTQGTITKRPDDWAEHMVTEDARQLEQLGQFPLANNLLRLLDACKALPEAA